MDVFLLISALKLGKYVTSNGNASTTQRAYESPAPDARRQRRASMLSADDSPMPPTHGAFKRQRVRSTAQRPLGERPPLPETFHRQGQASVPPVERDRCSRNAADMRWHQRPLVNVLLW